MKENTDKEISRPPKKVVLVQPAFVGDVILASPLVHSLKEYSQDMDVDLVVRTSSREVAQCIPGVSQVFAYDRMGSDSGLLGLWRIARTIREQKYDLLITPHRSSRSALLSWLSGVPLRVGYSNGLGRWVYHVASAPNARELCTMTSDLALLERVGVPVRGARLRLKGPVGKEEYYKDFYRRNHLPHDARLVALCIGAYWPTKRWPEVYFASLYESLRERGYVPVLFGGPDEREISTRIGETLKEEPLGCVGNSLVEAATLLARCEMAVGGDSGLPHMARALGLPTVLIYGPTDHRMHPFGEKTKVLTAKIKCRPCSKIGKRRCPQKHHDCMRLISPEHVLDALKELVNLRTPVPRQSKSGPVRQECAS